MAIKGVSPEHIKYIKEAKKAYKQFVLPNAKRIREAKEAFNRIRTIIEKLPPNHIKCMKEAKKAYEQFVPEYMKFYKKHGWLLDLITNETLVIIMNLTDKHFEDGISIPELLEGLDEIFHTEEGLKFVLDKIPKVIQRRKQYIQNVVELHKNNNYTSSIPLALIQIDGIVRDFSVLKGYLENEENPERLAQNGKRAYFKDIVAALFKEKKFLMSMEIKQPLTRVLREELYTKNIRHSIIHGNNLAYEDSILSTRLIAVLITLAQKLPGIEKTSKIKPYWKR